MKILEINKFNFAKGGADRHFLDVCELLKKNGHEVAVFSMKHKQNLKSPWERYFLSTVGYTGEYSFWQKIKGLVRMFYSFEAKKKINDLLNEFQPDIAHIHNIYHQMSPIILFEIKKRNIPIIMTVHDYKLISPNYNLYHKGELYNRCREGKYYRCFLDKCVKNSWLKSFIAALEAYWHGLILKTYFKNIDAYIIPSVFARNILVDCGVDSRKMNIVPHFIKSVKTGDTNALFSKNEENYVLYCGRISNEKGVDILIETVENINGLKLYLAGGIENNYHIRESEKIKYLGFLDEEDLRLAIDKACCVISGSRLPETFGMVALEALSRGRPFVGFKTGAYSEIIEDGINGFLVQNPEELLQILQKIADNRINFDSDLIRKKSQNQFGNERYYQKFMKIAKIVVTRALDKKSRIC